MTLLAVVLLSALAACGRGGFDAKTAAQGAATYENPVLPGDHPDPTVIRVGEDYWATATTSQWAPIFPLLHSTDLVNWRLVGSVFRTPPSWSAGSYWAPELWQDGGRFFVYYTARRRGGPLCVAVADADNPEGPYTDRGPLVCQEVGSIDAMAVRDENGRPYLVWKEDGNSRKLPTPMWAQPLSEDGIRLVGEKQEILRNEEPWEAHLVEGAFILRRGGLFYMFYSADACCGRRCNYKLGVARAKRLLGPWERHRGNPILAANESWKCPGHGSIVEHPSGRTFLLYHAYHPEEFEYVGRQGLLDEVTWGQDGWPAINGGRGPSRSAALPPGAEPRRPPAPVRDDFAVGALDPAWQWPWDQPLRPALESGVLRIGTGSGTSAVAARPAPASSYVAATVLNLASITPGGHAGLAAFGNRENVVAVTAPPPGDVRGGRAEVTVWRMQKGERTPLASARIETGGALHLQLRATDRTRFEFAVSPDGRAWRTLTTEAEGAFLPPWDLATRVALFVAGGPETSATFDRFTLETVSDPAR